MPPFLAPQWTRFAQGVGKWGVPPRRQNVILSCMRSTIGPFHNAQVFLAVAQWPRLLKHFNALESLFRLKLGLAHSGCITP